MGHAAGLPRDRRAARAQLRRPIRRRRRLIDGLDIFIIPSINADGATYSMFDFNRPAPQHGQLLRVEPDGQQRPGGPQQLGRRPQPQLLGRLVLRRLHRRVARTAPATRSRARSELSEPETRNETYIQTTYPNIKFAMNVHSSGGYFMWPPGAYKADRTTLPYPPYGTLNYFDQTASSVLERIYSYRKTAILPAQTGPVTDVLYSAAGNSADEAYYNHGIIGYDFEIGATKRLADGTTASPGFQPPFGAVPIGGNAEPRQRGSRRGHGVLQRQLRPPAVRARLRQRHDRPVLRRRPARRCPTLPWA